MNGSDIHAIVAQLVVSSEVSWTIGDAYWTVTARPGRHPPHRLPSSAALSTSSLANSKTAGVDGIPRTLWEAS